MSLFSMLGTSILDNATVAAYTSNIRQQDLGRAPYGVPIFQHYVASVRVATEHSLPSAISVGRSCVQPTFRNVSNTGYSCVIHNTI